MKWLMIVALVIALLSGCQMKNDQNALSHQRWSQARGGVMCGLAGEHLKTGDLIKARTAALEALQLDQKNVPARVVLAKVMVEQGHYARAIEELRIAELLANENAEVAHLLGVALEKRGEHADALKYYGKARALDPSQDAYVTASAEVLVAMGKPAQGLELLEARLLRREVSPDVEALAGELAMLLEKYDKACQFYQQCLDSEPNNLLAREGIAKAYFFAGRFPDALKVLETLVADPAYCGRAMWVYLMLGDSHMAMRRPSKAREAYRLAIQIDPASGPVWNGMAQACLALGDVSGASAAARKALILGGDCLDAAVVLAYGMMHKGDNARAFEVLYDQASKHPEDATVLCMLGQCYQRLGRKDQATGCYRKVLQSDPEHRLAKTLLTAAGQE